MSAPIFKPTDQGLVRKLIDRVRFLGDGYTEVRSPTFGSVSSGRQSARLAWNCYRVNNQGWRSYDTTQPAAILSLEATGFILFTAPASAGLLAFSTYVLAPSSGAVDSGWLDLGSFGTNWSAYLTSDDFKPQYRKLPSGLVLLRGLVKKGAALAPPETISTGLPAGYRPGAASRQQIYNQANAANNVTDLRITGGGAISLAGGGSASWTSLDGIAYLAEA